MALIIKGIKSVARESRNYVNISKGQYLQLFYNLKYKECWTTPHCSFGHNSWTEYDDPDVLDCSFIDTPMTMEEIRRKIEGAVERHELWEAEKKGK